MSVKKLSDEELLALASQDVKTEKSDARDLTEVQKFIAHFNVKDGNDKVDGHVVYQLYYDWRKQIPNKKNGTKMLKRRVFLMGFCKFFRKINTSPKGIRYHHYYLDRTNFNIFSDKEMDELFWKSRRQINKEKANLEKQKKAKNAKI